jgi:hypothetical protein
MIRVSIRRRGASKLVRGGDVFRAFPATIFLNSASFGQKL